MLLDRNLMFTAEGGDPASTAGDSSNVLDLSDISMVGDELYVAVCGEGTFNDMSIRVKYDTDPGGAFAKELVKVPWNNAPDGMEFRIPRMSYGGYLRLSWTALSGTTGVIHSGLTPSVQDQAAVG